MSTKLSCHSHWSSPSCHTLLPCPASTTRRRRRESPRRLTPRRSACRPSQYCSCTRSGRDNPTSTIISSYWLQLQLLFYPDIRQLVYRRKHHWKLVKNYCIIGHHWLKIIGCWELKEYSGFFQTDHLENSTKEILLDEPWTHSIKHDNIVREIFFIQHKNILKKTPEKCHMWSHQMTDRDPEIIYFEEIIMLRLCLHNIDILHLQSQVFYFRIWTGKEYPTSTVYKNTVPQIFDVRSFPLCSSSRILSNSPTLSSPCPDLCTQLVYLAPLTPLVKQCGNSRGQQNQRVKSSI